MDMSRKKIIPIKQNDKIEQIINFIHNYIIEGNLQPGTELPSEKNLSEQLGVSRFSLREALRVVQSQGLIEIAQGKKPVVAHPSVQPAASMLKLALMRSNQSLLDLTVARTAIECTIVRIAAVKISDEALMKLEENIKLMEIKGRDIEYYIEKDIEFHNIILESTENLVLEIMLASVTEFLRKSRKATLEAGGVKRAYTAHEAIFKALKNHDPEKSEIEMRRHFTNAEEDLKASGLQHIKEIL